MFKLTDEGNSVPDLCLGGVWQIVPGFGPGPDPQRWKLNRAVSASNAQEILPGFGNCRLSPVPASNPQGVGVVSAKAIVTLTPLSKPSTAPPLSVRAAPRMALDP